MLDLDHTLLDFNRHDPPTPSLREFQKTGHGRVFGGRLRGLRSGGLEPDALEMAGTEAHRALGMLSSSKYKICFVLDKTSMFRIVSRRKDGSEFKHAVKPLRLIWDKVDGWNA